MKLIHISDLHLGKRLNEYSLTEDQEYILKKILGVIESEHPDGVIIADNTTWDGKVIEEPAPRDAQSVGILEFNDLVASDNRFSSIMLPLRDGVTIAIRR